MHLTAIVFVYFSKIKIFCVKVFSNENGKKNIQIPCTTAEAVCDIISLVVTRLQTPSGEGSSAPEDILVYSGV